MLTRRAGNPAVSTARARRNPTVRDFRDRIRPGSGLLTHRPHPMRRCRWHLPTHRERPGQCPLKAGYRRRGEASLRVWAGQPGSAVGVRGCPCDPPSGCQRPRTYGGQRRRGECRSAAFAQVRGYVMGRGAAGCKTVGSAYVGSNPTPATRFRRSEPVTLNGVTGFPRQRERFIRPSALFRGLCVGRIRPSPGFGRYRFRYHLNCGNVSNEWCLRAVVRVCQDRRPWAMPGAGDTSTYRWRTGSWAVPTVHITACFHAL